MGGPIFTVAVVGILAAIAIPNFVTMQLKAKRAEVPAHVAGIQTAEIAYHQAHGEFLACGDADGALARIGKQPREWAGDPASECFAELGWQPDGPIRGAYWVEVGVRESGEARFVVNGVSDVDGDEGAAQWTADETGAEPVLVTQANVY